MLLAYYHSSWPICPISCALKEDMKTVYFLSLASDSKLVNKRIRESVSNPTIVYKIETFVIFHILHYWLKNTHYIKCNKIILDLLLQSTPTIQLK